jgi:Na+/proline symporter
MGWIAIHYFMIGAEWAFVQRYLCVPSEKDARKSTYLFGVLYLFSPFLWLLPPLLWRIQQPIPADADSETVTKMAETAYILSCKAVLPNGMLGLMLAALFSATASMISTQLNVFSGVLTNNIYKSLVRNPGEDQLVNMGRIFTCLLGCCIAAIAIIMPYMGGAAVVIISIAELMVTPILAPTLGAMYFKKLDSTAIWITVGICFPLGLMGRFLPAFQDSFIGNTTLTGVILPMFIVGVLALLARREAPGWDKIRQSQKLAESAQQLEANPMPALIVSIGLGLCAITLFALILVNDRDRGLLAGFGFALTVLAFGMYLMYKRMNRRASINSTRPDPGNSNSAKNGQNG